jgi:hypothetical protein
LLGNHSRWRPKEGPLAAVTAAPAKGNPLAGLTALGEREPDKSGILREWA